MSTQFFSSLSQTKKIKIFFSFYKLGKLIGQAFSLEINYKKQYVILIPYLIEVKKL